MNNIAEGIQRNSDKEFQRFLKISKGPAGEVRSMLWIAIDLYFINNNEADSLIEQYSILSSKIARLIKYLNKQ